MGAIFHADSRANSCVEILLVCHYWCARLAFQWENFNIADPQLSFGKEVSWTIASCNTDLKREKSQCYRWKEQGEIAKFGWKISKRLRLYKYYGLSLQIWRTFLRFPFHLNYAVFSFVVWKSWNFEIRDRKVNWEQEDALTTCVKLFKDDILVFQIFFSRIFAGITEGGKKRFNLPITIAVKIFPLTSFPTYKIFYIQCESFSPKREWE